MLAYALHRTHICHNRWSPDHRTSRPHLGISEEEHRVLVLHSRHLVQLLEVFVEGCVVVAPADLYLETLVPTHVGGQPGQALLARAPHAHQKGIAPRLTDHACYSVGCSAKKDIVVQCKRVEHHIKRTTCTLEQNTQM